MGKKWILASFCVLTVVLGGACIPEEPQVAEDGAPRYDLMTQSQLEEEWKDVVQNADENLEDPAYSAIMWELAEFGPDALIPMLDIVADDSYSPAARVVTADRLKYHAHPRMVPRLKELATGEFDNTTRACATFLLGLIPTEETTALLRELEQSDEPRIRFSAILGLANAGDEDALAQLREKYAEQDLDVEYRRELVNFFAFKGKEEDVEILSNAVLREELTVFQRALVAASLADIGDPAAIPALEKLKNHENEALRNIAGDAIKAIEAQNEEEV